MSKKRLLLSFLLASFFSFEASSFALVRHGKTKSKTSKKTSTISRCEGEACALASDVAADFLATDTYGDEFADFGDDLDSVAAKGSFWPVEGVLTGDFGKWRGGGKRKGKKRAGGHVHAGVDIAAPYGTTVVAPLAGTVNFVGNKGAYGLTLVIDHGNGISTLYAHNSKVLVSEGDTIRKGQRISKIGLSGRSTGPHLHYEVHKEGKIVNPLVWTKKLQTQTF